MKNKWIVFLILIINIILISFLFWQNIKLVNEKKELQNKLLLIIPHNPFDIVNITYHFKYLYVTHSDSINNCIIENLKTKPLTCR